MPTLTQSPAAPRRATLLAVLAVAAFWLVEAGMQRLYQGPVARVSIWGLEWALARTALDCGALVLAALVLGRLQALPRLITWAFGLGCVIGPLSWAWYLRVAEEEALALPVIAAFAAPIATALAWAVWSDGIKGALLSQVPGLAFVGAQIGGSYMSGDLLWVSVEDAQYQDEAGGADLDVEALYAAQPSLMAAQIAALAPQRPGQVDVFALALGGTADQSVFANQVDAVGDILQANYGAGSRLIKLLNSEDDPLRYPLADHANLTQALAAIGARMGPEDVAFLYLASHGGREVFSLSFWQAGLNDLYSDELAPMLAESGIGTAVIVISACHAGSFTDNLAAPNRLIIAAARADRTSFGCADGRDWTEFDRSFFDFALRQDPDPRKAFDLAVSSVWWKELTGLRKHSYPQMEVGAAVGPALDAMLAAQGK